MSVKDMTTGNPVRLILEFALPVFIGNLFQQLYNVVDTLIVGRTLGVGALAAVGSTGAFSFLVIGFIFGITAGFSVVTAQRFGAKDFDGVRKSFTTSVFLSIILTFFMTVISVSIAMPLLKVMRTPIDIINMAYDYIVVICLGIGTIIFYNVISNTIRALGDSRTPLYFLIFSAVLNVFLDILFIVNFKMGVSGAGWATVLSQGISGFLCLFYMFFKFPILRLKKSDWNFDWAFVWEHIRIGFPMGIQLSVMTIGMIAVQMVLNSFGSNTVAAFTAAVKVDQLSTQYFVAIGVAMATYTAQNFGAGKFNRIRTGTEKCFLINSFLSGLSIVLILLFGRTLVGFLFMPDTPEIIYRQAQMYMYIIMLFYFALSTIMLLRNVLQGVGDAKFPLVTSVIELVMRTVAAFVLGHYFGYLGVCFATPCAWVVGAVWLYFGYKKTMKKIVLSAANREQPLSFLGLND